MEFHFLPIVMQEAFNKLKTDNARKNSKKILVDMLNRAVDTDLHHIHKM